MNAPSISMIPASHIQPGDNDRHTFNPRALQALADSIRDNGLAQPITIRPVYRCEHCRQISFSEPPGHPGRWVETCFCGAYHSWPARYQIVAGERRFRACAQLLGWDKIPSIVRDLTDEEADAVMLTENVHRVDLNPIDEGYAYQKRIDRHGWSVAEIARRTNVGGGRIKNRLSLLLLRPEAQKLIIDGHLGLGFGEEMSVLDNNRQLIALSWLRDQKATPNRRTFAAIVGQLYAEQCQETLFDLDAFFAPTVIDSVLRLEGQQLGDLLPHRADLPGLPHKKGKGGIGLLIDAYCTLLLTNGHATEATVVIDLLAKLSQANYVFISAYDSRTLALLSGDHVP